MNTDDNRVVLHILVIGFHHRKGCQVEFSYPPLVNNAAEDSNALPPEWKYLPTLALPDGAHNFNKDTIYFHLKNRSSTKHTVYGVSCYRQIDAKDLVNKTDDITRATVQKSVCVLTTLPMYGAIAAKLELITHAWFEQKDFTKVDLLKDAFYSLQASVSPECMETQAFLGLNVHDVVKLYKHKIVMLFKLMLLERKVVFFMSPVRDLCNVILSILSLFPGLLEYGMVESVQNIKVLAISPTMTEQTLTEGDAPFIDIHYTRKDNSEQTAGSAGDFCKPISVQPESIWLQNSHRSGLTPPVMHGIHEENVENLAKPVKNQYPVCQNDKNNLQKDNTTNGATAGGDSLLGESFAETADIDEICKNRTSAVELQRNSSLSSYKEGIPEVHHSSKSLQAYQKTDPVNVPSVSEALVSEAVFAHEPVTHTQALSSQPQSVTLTELDSEEAVKEIDIEDQACFSWDENVSLALQDDTNLKDASEENVSTSRNTKNLSIEIPPVRDVRVVPVVSPTSLTIDKMGFPLAIFTKGSVCHPYLSLSYYDILEDVNIRSFIIGASNVLFKQKKHNVDIIVEGDPQLIYVHDKELMKQLQLTTEDLRFADMITKQVDDNVAAGNFLENTEWEGGDEWIRTQFRNYLLSLMATVLANDTKLLEGFNVHFVNAWKTTHNYKIWRNTVQQLQDVIPGHVCQGGVSLNDMKLHLNRTERGKKFNAAIDHTGKVVGEALGSAKTFVSSWWSNMTSPTSTNPVNNNE